MLFDAADGEEWTAAEMREVRQGALAVAAALAKAINANRQSQAMARRIGEPFEPFAYTPISARDAFLSVYGGSVTFYKTGDACATGCWGEYVSAQPGIGDRVINVYTNAYDGTNLDITSAFEDGYNHGELWAVHELGHAFEGRLSNELGVTGPARTALGNSGVTVGAGFAGPFPGWRQSDLNGLGEEFADSFIGWTYGRWETNALDNLTPDGGARRNFMQQSMSLWVNQLAP